MANAIGVLAYFSVTMGLCTAAVAYGNNMTFWDSQRAKCTHFFPFVFDQSQYKYGVLALALAISTACYLMFLRAYNVRLCSPPPPTPLVILGLAHQCVAPRTPRRLAVLWASPKLLPAPTSCQHRLCGCLHCVDHIGSYFLGDPATHGNAQEWGMWWLKSGTHACHTLIRSLLLALRCP